MKKIISKLILIVLLVASGELFIAGSSLNNDFQIQNDCPITNNFFENEGGRLGDQKVKGSDGCKTLFMDDGFEKITLMLGSIPETSADFTIVDYDSEPGEGEISVKYYYYSGNEEETLKFDDSGKTAHVCNNGGKITVSWDGVKFLHTANAKLSYKTKCEMSCP